MQLGQGQVISTELRQEQVLGVKQLQALRILTTPIQELSQLISQEISENPVLELEKDSREVSLEVTEDKLFNEAMQLENSSGGSELRYHSAEGEARRQHFFDSITSTTSFSEQLLNQIRLLELRNELTEACITLIGEVDSGGYLKLNRDELEMLIGSRKLADEALATVQSLDPAGVAAHDLSERLLIQLDRKGDTDQVVRAVIREHLEDLAANRLPLICRRLRISMPQLEYVMERIRTLQPNIQGDAGDAAEYVQEEIVVKVEDGEPVAKMLKQYQPVLKISKQYQRMIEDPAISAEDKKFIKAKISDAIEFMKKIHDRETTIDKIMTIILREQRDFFFKGDRALIPLTMTAVAGEIGCHETTVSRAVSGKYLRCSFGLVALRKFFSTSVIASSNSSGGDEVSGSAVKDRIRKIIESENVYKPLSDNKISKLLEMEGLQVARRTVAKYRESLGIAATSKRKKFK